MSLRTTKQTRAAVQSAVDEMDRKIQAIADQVRRDRVIPACRRLRADFYSGMGAYFFSTERETIDRDDSNRHRLRALFEMLDIEVTNTAPLGYWLSSVYLVDLDCDCRDCASVTCAPAVTSTRSDAPGATRAPKAPERGNPKC